MHTIFSQGGLGPIQAGFVKGRDVSIRYHRTYLVNKLFLNPNEDHAL